MKNAILPTKTPVLHTQIAILQTKNGNPQTQIDDLQTKNPNLRLENEVLQGENRVFAPVFGVFPKEIGPCGLANCLL